MRACAGRWFPAFRDRIMGNPRFLLVLAIEEVIGCTAKTIAEYQARGTDFWKVRTPCMCLWMRLKCSCI